MSCDIEEIGDLVHITDNQNIIDEKIYEFDPILVFGDNPQITPEKIGLTIQEQFNITSKLIFESDTKKTYENLKKEIASSYKINEGFNNVLVTLMYYKLKYADKLSEIDENTLNHFENLITSNTRGYSGVQNVTVVMDAPNSCTFKCSYCPDLSREKAIKITVPDNINPGDTFKITNKDGYSFDFVCPDDVLSGQEIFVKDPYRVPKSYIAFEPAVLRAIQNNYDIVKQIRCRVKTLIKRGTIKKVRNSRTNEWETSGKIEIRLIGGTFHVYPKQERYDTLRDVYYALNTIDYEDDDMRQRYSLKNEIILNNNYSNCKCTVISIETRPDSINLETIQEMNELGITKVEIGVQSLYNKVLRLIDRGHLVKSVVSALRLLQSNGFKVGIHIMPDLPGSNPEMDIAMLDFQADDNGNVYKKPNNKFNFENVYLIDIITGFVNKYCDASPSLMNLAEEIKFYPCDEVPGTKLSELKERGLWMHYSEDDDKSKFINVMKIYMLSVMHWVRVNRIKRDFEESSERNQGMGYVSKNVKGNLHQILTDKIKKEFKKCVDIRTREIRNGSKVNSQLRIIDIVRFKSYNGIEYFIQIIDEYNNLFGMLRLRINDDQKFVINEIKNCAIIREVHVYGHTKGIGESKFNDKKAQHKGYGKILISTAELIAYEHGFNKIAVLSAVGTRGYYCEKVGKYNMIGRYAVKNLNYFEHIINRLKVLLWSLNPKELCIFITMFMFVAFGFINLLQN